MNSDLLSNNYLIIKNFISTERAVQLDKEFKLCHSFYNFKGDPQAPNSTSIYNYLPALEILCEKTPEVSKLIGETVLPTYTYSRIYRNGSVLTKHTDRSACEISLTLHLNGDKPWSIWIENPQGKPRCVVLEPGDAMLYLGCVAPHWRDEYVGQEYSQIFLHYVRSRGSFCRSYFDKDKSNTDDISKIIKEYREMGWMSNELIERGFIEKESPYKIKNVTSNFTKKPSNEVKIEGDFTVFGKKSSPFLVNKKFEEPEISNNSNKISERSLKDYIKVFDNFVPADFCDLIVNEYKDSDEWNHTLTGSGHDPSARNCSSIPISVNDIILQNEEVRKSIDQTLFEIVGNVVDAYSQLFPETKPEIKEDSGYELLKYNEGQFYVEHTDSFKEMPRALSCIISLNDDYEGGEVSFFSREITHKLKKGDILLFPSSFMYPHEIQTITKGTRYSIITWLV